MAWLPVLLEQIDLLAERRAPLRLVRPRHPKPNRRNLMDPTHLDLEAELNTVSKLRGPRRKDLDPAVLEARRTEQRRRASESCGKARTLLVARHRDEYDAIYVGFLSAYADRPLPGD